MITTLNDETTSPVLPFGISSMQPIEETKSDAFNQHAQEVYKKYEQMYTPTLMVRMQTTQIIQIIQRPSTTQTTQTT